MQQQTIILKKKDSVALIRLNRPDSLNALSFQMEHELGDLVEEINRDDSTRVVILTGEGRAFSAGADIKEMMSPGKPSIQTLLFEGNSLPICKKLENMDKPVIGAINGLAIGGGFELALSCDLRIASSTAQFGMGESKIGSIPGGGGTVKLPRFAGIAKAKELLFFGDPIDAGEAYRLGLVNKVVPPELLLEEAMKWAVTLSKRPPLALKAAKSCVNYGMQMPLSAALLYEAREWIIVNKSEDVQEGMKAFLEKREPLFKGK